MVERISGIRSLELDAHAGGRAGLAIADPGDAARDLDGALEVGEADLELDDGVERRGVSVSMNMPPSLMFEVNSLKNASTAE